MQERRSNADRRAQTRQALLETARPLFAEKGFAATGTPEVVAQAGVTRGALYHHFADKAALFEAVIEAEADAIAAAIESATEDLTGAEALRQGGRAYLRTMREPGRLRLMLVEAPAVLGPDVLRRIDADTGGRTLREGLQQVCGGGEDADALADLLSAMYDRAALAIGAGADPASYEVAIDRFLDRLTADRGS